MENPKTVHPAADALPAGETPAEAEIDATAETPSEDGLSGLEAGRLGSPVEAADGPGWLPAAAESMTAEQRRELADLFSVCEEHSDGTAAPVDRELVAKAFVAAWAAHSGDVRLSGDSFVTHPISVARICAGLRLDSATLCAALLHDTVEDTAVTLEDVEREFTPEIARLVDGVTKLAGITFHSLDEKQAENFRKMIVAMAHDVRVILIKLADRLHNMRTLSALPKGKQIEKAKETLDIYAPLAHRLGIHAMKWELEDLSFQALHPRKYAEIKELVQQQRGDRERYVERAAEYLRKELDAVEIDAEISGRAKHFYSIYAKMTRKHREFNEIYDLTAMRVIVDSVKDCYGAVGVIHALWKPLPGRFKDFIAMPKVNMYQALHTTVIGPEARPLEIQIRTAEMHALAEYGVAAHWAYKRPDAYGREPQGATRKQPAWLKTMLDWQRDERDAAAFMDSLKVDLFEDEVFVFTPKGEVKSLPAESTPLDFAYAVHTDVGHHCVGAKVNGKIVPLHYSLRSGDIVQILTTKRERGPSRDWLALVKTSRARNKIGAFLKRESREDSEHRGRESLHEALRKEGLPAQKVVGSGLIADVLREMGFKRADDFYVALGEAKISPQVVINKVIQRLKHGESAAEEGPSDTLAQRRPISTRTTRASSAYGIAVEGVTHVDVRLAKCCWPVPGDEIVGYVSLGKGITIHRGDCSNVSSLEARSPERFAVVSWEGQNQAAFRAEICVDAWDRTRLLEDLSRTLAEAGVNIIEARCQMADVMVRNRFVVEVGDIRTLRSCIARLRGIESVFDVYRVTPTQ